MKKRIEGGEGDKESWRKKKREEAMMGVEGKGENGTSEGTK